MLARLLEIIVILLVIRAVWRALSSMIAISGGVRRTTATSGQPRAVKLVRDPVCGTYVSPDSAISDGTHYFCSEKCRNEFRSQATETQRRRG